MSKKAWYAIGALTALGLLTPQANAAAAPVAHAPGKTVRTDVSQQPGAAPDAHCVARSHSKHTKEVSKVRLTFWTAPGHDATCIGTIKVSTKRGDGVTYVSEYVQNNYGSFCYDGALGFYGLTFACREYFRYEGLGVVASWYYSGKLYRFKLPV